MVPEEEERRNPKRVGKLHVWVSLVAALTGCLRLLVEFVRLIR